MTKAEAPKHIERSEALTNPAAHERAANEFLELEARLQKDQMRLRNYLAVRQTLALEACAEGFALDDRVPHRKPREIEGLGGPGQGDHPPARPGQ